MRVNSPITISKHHRLDIGLLLLNRAKTNTNSAARNFNEVTGTLNYVFSF
jgi:hypothetical protein